MHSTSRYYYWQNYSSRVWNGGESLTKSRSCCTVMIRDSYIERTRSWQHRKHKFLKQTTKINPAIRCLPDQRKPFDKQSKPISAYARWQCNVYSFLCYRKLHTRVKYCNKGIIFHMKHLLCKLCRICHCRLIESNNCRVQILNRFCITLISMEAMHNQTPSSMSFKIIQWPRIKRSALKVRRIENWPRANKG